jgi:transcriptional regulator with XRE-family HTH domain
VSSPTKRRVPAKPSSEGGDRLADNLRKAREKSGLSLEAVGQRVGATKGAVHGWEKGSYPPGEDKLERLATLYGTTPGDLRYGTGAVREDLAEYTPNPALKNRLRPQPRARVYEHIQAMVNAGCTIDQIDEAERLMIDGAYNKLNKRDARERSDAEMIMDIDAAWVFIKEVLEREGAKGL